MLWYKTWLETRWRFLIGLALLICSAAGVVFMYPQTMKVLEQMPTTQFGGELGRRIQEATDLARQYRGYVWSQGFRQSLIQMATLFAVLLGTGGLLSPPSAGALLTLSLPASRNRLVGIRAATGLAEWLAITLVPALLIPILSPAVGERYSVGASLIHGGCMFLAGSAFFSLALLLSTMFADLWRPLLIALSLATLLGIAEQLAHVSRFGIFGVMSGESYFRTGRVPWWELFAVTTLSAAMLVAAARNFARRDF